MQFPDPVRNQVSNLSLQLQTRGRYFHAFFTVLVPHLIRLKPEQAISLGRGLPMSEITPGKSYLKGHSSTSHQATFANAEQGIGSNLPGKDDRCPLQTRVRSQNLNPKS